LGDPVASDMKTPSWLVSWSRRFLVSFLSAEILVNPLGMGGVWEVERSRTDAKAQSGGIWAGNAAVIR